MIESADCGSHGDGREVADREQPDSRALAFDWQQERLQVTRAPGLDAANLVHDEHVGFEPAGANSLARPAPPSGIEDRVS